MPTTATLTIRTATPHDTTAAVELLAAAYTDTETARWVVPDPDTRRAYSQGRLSSAVDHALHHGIVQLATDRADTIGAALWLPHPGPAPHQPDPPPTPSDRGGDPDRDMRAALHRRRRLDWMLHLRHPGRPHQHLTHLAVRPDRRGHGVGSQLLLYHHAYLHTLGLPGYLETDNPDSHDLFQRHGYTTIGPPLLIPGTGIPIWPMWRPPGPSHHRPHPQPPEPPRP